MHMDEDEVAHAIATGDDITMAAVLDTEAPGFLCRLSDTEKEAYRHEWRKERFPREIERVAHLREQLDHVVRAGDLLMLLYEKLWSPSMVAKGQQSDRVPKATLAGL